MSRCRNRPEKIPVSFYERKDVVAVARDLLGCTLWSLAGGELTAGVIVETEAYDGETDRASHAFCNKKTDRTVIFFRNGGIAYTYLCYGIHTLFNIITGPEGTPHAVLIRAVAPCLGIQTMLRRRKQDMVRRNTAGGPAMLTCAMGIGMRHNGENLQGDTLWLTPRPELDLLPSQRTPQCDEQPGTCQWVPEIPHRVTASDILASPRVGVGYAGKDALLPWRFRLRNCRWTSPARGTE